MQRARRAVRPARTTRWRSPATHNSMSAADNPRLVLPRAAGRTRRPARRGHPRPAHRHLVRPGDPAIRRHRDLRAAGGRGAGAADGRLRRRRGPGALRLRDCGVADPTGPEQPYLCHGFCELGSRSCSARARRRRRVDGQPTRARSSRCSSRTRCRRPTPPRGSKQAGLLPYVHTQEVGQPWPTLGEMISSGRRLVVLMENQGGGSEYPWLMQGFDWVQDTPFDATKQSQFSCAAQPRRGRTTRSSYQPLAEQHTDSGHRREAGQRVRRAVAARERVRGQTLRFRTTSRSTSTIKVT